MKHECKECHKEYFRNGNRPSSFCSRKCKNDFQRLTSPRECQICGRVFTPQYAAIAKGAGNHCSSACFNRSRWIIILDGRPVWQDKEGYLRINLGNRVWKYVHTYLLEKALGVNLKGKIVHHKDGNRLNNALDNLQVFDTITEHMREHARMRRADKN